jgi:hypothetical protein
MRHRADEGAAVGDAGQAREMFADLDSRHDRVDRAKDTANLLRRLGLQVPQLVLRGSPVQIQEDDTFGLAEAVLR